jgi:hypothetical protein
LDKLVRYILAFATLKTVENVALTYLRGKYRFWEFQKDMSALVLEAAKFKRAEAKADLLMRGIEPFGAMLKANHRSKPETARPLTEEA